MKKLLMLSLIISANLFAETQTINLGETIVKSTSGFDKKLMKENKNVVLITSEDIKKKQYTDVESILRDTPNVVIQNTQFGPVVNLRGSGERSMSRVKIMVDGLSITPLEENMGTLPINSIPVGSIEKIEIIPGGGSVLYGSGTTGGVVNIITKADLNKNFVNTNIKYGSDNLKETGVAFGQKVDENLFVNFSGQYTNKNGYRDSDELEARAVSGGFDLKLNDKNRIKFQASDFKDNGITSTAILKSALDEDRKQKGQLIDSESNRKSFSLDYEFKAKENLTLYANVFKTKYDRNFEQGDTRDVQMPQIGAMPMAVMFKDLYSTMYGTFAEETEGINLKAKYKYDKGDLLVGYSYTGTNMKRGSNVVTEQFKFSDGYVGAPGNWFPIDPNFTSMVGTMEGKVLVDTKIDLNKDTHALYALNDYKINDKLNFIAGARWEYSDYSGNRSATTTMNGYGINNGGMMGGTIFNPDLEEVTISPDGTEGTRVLSKNTIDIDQDVDNFAGELGLTYQYRDTGSVYARYERGFISPLPAQLTNKDFVTKEYKNNNLKSEKIDNIEFGVKDVVGNSYISATVFASQTKDEITMIDKDGGNPMSKTWAFDNISETRRYGAEVYAEQYFDKLRITESLTYVDAEITKADGEYGLKKGENVPLVSKFKATLGLDYNLNKNIILGSSYTYNSGYDSKEAGDGTSIITSSVSGYGVMDIYAIYALNNSFNLKVGINNVLEEEYNVEEYSSTAVPASERNYYAGFSYTL